MAAQPQTDWVDEAATLYAKGLSLVAVAQAVGYSHETVRRQFQKRGYPMRTKQETWNLKAAIELANRPPPPSIETRIARGMNGHLDRGIARLEAQIADDMTRNGSAFSDGGM